MASLSQGWSSGHTLKPSTTRGEASLWGVYRQGGGPTGCSLGQACIQPGGLQDWGALDILRVLGLATGARSLLGSHLPLGPGAGCLVALMVPGLSPVYTDCLLMLAYKDRSERTRGLRERSNLTLADICGLEPGLPYEGLAHTLAIVCLSQTVMLGFDSRETMCAWDARIRYALGEGE